tara:strand:+ start:924 stop:1175 length:252 start_codon:yes stop_codon:yes gene_type:complete
MKIKVEQDHFMSVCTCNMPQPKIKNSENGISAYCGKCAKAILKGRQEDLFSVIGSNCCKQCKEPIEKGFRFCSGECKQYYYRF